MLQAQTRSYPSEGGGGGDFSDTDSSLSHRPAHSPPYDSSSASSSPPIALSDSPTSSNLIYHANSASNSSDTVYPMSRSSASSPSSTGGSTTETHEVSVSMMQWRPFGGMIREQPQDIADNRREDPHLNSNLKSTNDNNSRSRDNSNTLERSSNQTVKSVLGSIFDDSETEGSNIQPSPQTNARALGAQSPAARAALGDHDDTRPRMLSQPVKEHEDSPVNSGYPGGSLLVGWRSSTTLHDSSMFPGSLPSSATVKPPSTFYSLPSSPIGSASDKFRVGIRRPPPTLNSISDRNTGGFTTSLANALSLDSGKMWQNEEAVSSVSVPSSPPGGVVSSPFGTGMGVFSLKSRSTYPTFAGRSSTVSEPVRRTSSELVPSESMPQQAPSLVTSRSGSGGMRSLQSPSVYYSHPHSPVEGSPVASSPHSPHVTGSGPRFSSPNKAPGSTQNYKHYSSLPASPRAYPHEEESFREQPHVSPMHFAQFSPSLSAVASSGFSDLPPTNSESISVIRSPSNFAQNTHTQSSPSASSSYSIWQSSTTLNGRLSVGNDLAERFKLDLASRRNSSPPGSPPRSGSGSGHAEPDEHLGLATDPIGVRNLAVYQSNRHSQPSTPARRQTDKPHAAHQLPRSASSSRAPSRGGDLEREESHAFRPVQEEVLRVSGEATTVAQQAHTDRVLTASHELGSADPVISVSEDPDRHNADTFNDYAERSATSSSDSARDLSVNRSPVAPPRSGAASECSPTSVDGSLNVANGAFVPSNPSDSPVQPSSGGLSSSASGPSNQPPSRRSSTSASHLRNSSDGSGNDSGLDRMMIRAEDALAHLVAYYDIRTVSSLGDFEPSQSGPSRASSSDAERAFAHEGCAICLDTHGTDSHSGPFVVLRCKRVGCLHVLHAPCVLNKRAVRLLLRSHPTSFFKVMVISHPPSQVSPHRIGFRRGCSFELLVTPMLSEVPIAKLACAHPVDSMLDVTNPPQFEYLFLFSDANSRPRSDSFFHIPRGRMVFRCNCPTTGEVWQYQANYELSSPPFSAAAEHSRLDQDLVLIDPASGAALIIKVSLQPNPNPDARTGNQASGSNGVDDSALAWCITGIRFELHAVLSGPSPHNPDPVALPMPGFSVYPQTSGMPMYANGNPVPIMSFYEAAPPSTNAGPYTGYAPPVYAMNGGSNPLNVPYPLSTVNPMSPVGVPVPVATPQQIAGGTQEMGVMHPVSSPDMSRSRHFFPGSPHLPPPNVIHSQSSHGQYDFDSLSNASHMNSGQGGSSQRPRDSSPSLHRPVNPLGSPGAQNLNDKYKQTRSMSKYDSRDQQGDSQANSAIVYPSHSPSQSDHATPAPASLSNFSPNSAALIRSDPFLQAHLLDARDANGSSGGNLHGSKPAPDSSDPIMPHVVGRVAVLAKSQCGSRFLQQRIMADDALYYEIVFAETFDHFPELMTDLFGNYLCQTVVEKCSDEQRSMLIGQLRPHLASISCDRQGTRAVQKLVASCGTSDQRAALIQSLAPQLLMLIRDPNGSHVVHSMLDNFPLNTPGVNIIFDTALANCRDLAMDQHGLCILKKCITLAPQPLFGKLAGKMLEHVLDFVNNQYGNYLVQHLVEKNDESVNLMLHKRLMGSYALLSRQKFSSNVVEKCLRVGSPQWQQAIIAELMTENTISSLLQDSYGNYVMQNALFVANTEQARLLVDLIRPRLQSLRKNIRKKWERLLNDSAFARSQGNSLNNERERVRRSNEARSDRERVRDRDREESNYDRDDDSDFRDRERDRERNDRAGHRDRERDARNKGDRERQTRTPQTPISAYHHSPFHRMPQSPAQLQSSPSSAQSEPAYFGSGSGNHAAISPAVRFVNRSPPAMQYPPAYESSPVYGRPTANMHPQFSRPQMQYHAQSPAQLSHYSGLAYPQGLPMAQSPSHQLIQSPAHLSYSQQAFMQPR